MRRAALTLLASAAMAAGVCAAIAAGPAAADEIAAADLDDLPAADVVILGEIHDNPAHHANQARAVAALRPSAIVFEMLGPAQAARITPALRGDEAALARALDWADSGWPDFALYYPILAAAPGARIYGAALPAPEVRRAVGEGAAAVFGAAEAGRYGLDRPLPAAEQAAREAEQMQAHCHAMPAALMPGMVEAQRLRDAAFARTALQALEETGGPVAVIAGTGHARTDWGMPRALAAAAPEVRVLALGQVEGAPEAPPPYDLWIVTPPLPRDEDPCAAFG